MRLLRIFRILKLGEYVSEFRSLGNALRASRRKILVFIGFVLIWIVFSFVGMTNPKLIALSDHPTAGVPSGAAAAICWG